MAPGTRRAGRSGYAEHDDFEGLPVRQWRHDWVNVQPPQPQEQYQQNDIWAVECMYGMPKDFQLLPPHSQELLRAARSGRLYRRPAPAEEEEADVDAVQPPDKVEKKEEEESLNQGFSIKQWKQIPRTSEGSGLSYLARRPQGIVTIASKTIEEKTSVPTVTRVTVKRIDAAGNPYTEEVTLTDGHEVLGEIISTRVEVVPSAQVEGFAAPTAPLRRRPPPPKKKTRAGPGRGRKKIKQTPTGMRLAPGMSVAANGGSAPIMVESRQENGTLRDGNGVTNPDSEMADGDDDDEDEGGDDGEEEGDDDQEDEDSRDDADDSKVQDEEMTDVADEPAPLDSSRPILDAMDGIETKPDIVPSNPFTLAPPPLASLVNPSPVVEGSPLKNVMLQSPTESRDSPSVPGYAAEIHPVPEPAPLSTALLPATVGERDDIEPPRPQSLIAEPPSTVAGDEGVGSADNDVPMTNATPEESVKPERIPKQTQVETQTAPSPQKQLSPDNFAREETLLPPPPEQVGNIFSPKSYDGPDRSSDGDDRLRDDPLVHSVSAPERPPLHPLDSTVTEDTIKPEDSASVRFPLTESGAPSEVGTAFAEETKDSTGASAIMVEEVAKPPSPSTTASLIAAAEPTSLVLHDDKRQKTPDHPNEATRDSTMTDSDREEKATSPEVAIVQHNRSPPLSMPTVSAPEAKETENTSVKQASPPQDDLVQKSERTPTEAQADAPAVGTASADHHQPDEAVTESGRILEEDVKQSIASPEKPLNEDVQQEATKQNADSESTKTSAAVPSVGPDDVPKDEPHKPQLPHSTSPSGLHLEPVQEPTIVEPADDRPNDEVSSALPPLAALPSIVTSPAPEATALPAVLPPILPPVSHVDLKNPSADNEGEDLTHDMPTYE